MTQGTASSVEATDGTRLDFVWAIPDGDQQSWERERQHWPRPFTPMELWFYAHGWPGADRAWEEAGLIAFHVFHRFQFVGPFLYVRRSPEPGERGREVIGRLLAKAREYEGALGFWKNHCDSRIRNAIETVPSEPKVEAFSEIAEAWQYGWRQTFTSMSMLFPLVGQLERLIPDSAADAGAIAQDLIAGDDNPSQGIDGAIWELAESVRDSEAARLIAGGEPLEAISAAPGGADFAAGLDRFVAQHADRALEWSMTDPTWGERPDAVLDLVRGRLRAGSRSPAEVQREASKRREALLAEVTAGVAADDLERFNELLSLLRGYVTIREERAYLQMVLSGRMRRMLLEYADALVEDGRLARREDILFVTPEAIQQGGSLQAEVDRARAEWERHSQLEMPPWIGAPWDGAGDQSTSTGANLQGIAGSGGIVTGPARVVHAPLEVIELEPGEILVCLMTTPAWTRLLGMAAALVTETGSAFSHPSIAAREYGIPCVVAVNGATTRISNGQTITVDGDAGVVTIA
jgi:pyruvate,water dikinase